MKKLFILVVFTLTSLAHSALPNSAARRSNSLLRFIAEHQGVRNVALYSVIATRCSRYLSFSEGLECREAVKKMMYVLDYDMIVTEPAHGVVPGSYVFVAFKKNLIYLLGSARTKAYLSDLNQPLYGYWTQGKEKFNIWDLTLKHYKTSDEAARVIAALFQDTSMLKLHLAYIERTVKPGIATFDNNVELLSRVIDTINQILDASEVEYRKLFYPATIEKYLNRNIYHFYVPLYLARALEKNGVSKNASFHAAFMPTLSYEFITAAQDYKFLYADPASISLTTKLQDIFGGYSGASFGNNKAKPVESFYLVKESFSRSTENGVDLLLR